MNTGRQLKQLTIDKIQRKTHSTHYIDDFIVSDNIENGLGLSFSHPYAFDGVAFFICLGGEALVNINMEEYTIVENSIITVSPNLVWEVISKSPDLVVKLLVLSYDYIPDLPTITSEYNIPQLVLTKPVLYLSKEDTENLLRYHTFLIETLRYKRHQYNQGVIKGLLFSLINEVVVLYQEVISQGETKKDSSGEEIVKDFFKLLRENITCHRNANFYADKLCITAKHLSVTLKKLTGRSVNIFIQEAIIRQIKVALKSSNKTVVEISDYFNFPCATYLGRFFKKNTGMTPMEYRNS